MATHADGGATHTERGAASADPWAPEHGADAHGALGPAAETAPTLSTLIGPAVAALISDPAAHRQAWHLDVTDHTARLARLNTRLTPGLWGLPGDVTEEAEQIVGDLAGHAVRRPGGPAIALGLTLDDDVLTLRVAGSGNFAGGRDSDLVILDALASHWGRTSTPHGSAVWAQLDLTGGTRSHA
ncbi:hypothetical protein [Streptomyces sp. Da 82-17]|uniref:hypothetical protein n=1 Tax=Streptomyces sp. Da 82-17 TaxID=3377116 RepID=UPI0038D36720